ncbi:hypothetical protein [Paenibacillus lemnae]|uniref:Uncharacterized protein n=1 Tax=Paenibacillus lemnae TaxID=1330551 RepID=A0A848M889_PAELE|nr:hypothetical protein [Paenibacillus lemnae]NMO96845.1 hypothetical protein [Paenibacillus lemnae]
MKKYLIILSFIASVSLVGCTNDRPEQMNITNTNQDPIVTDQDKESLQKENEELKLKLNELEAKLQEHDIAKEILNESFKLIGAMNDKNIDYLNSIMGPNVKFSEDSDKIITAKYGEMNFISIRMNELQYRGYVQQEEAEDKFQVFLARVYKEGNIAIYIDFIKVDDMWKYNGHVTN